MNKNKIEMENIESWMNFLVMVVGSVSFGIYFSSFFVGLGIFCIWTYINRRLNG